jgi:hypothetical protein
LSLKVIPAAPSAPVTITSEACSAVPTAAGMRAPSRSTVTEPFETFTIPTSAPSAGSAIAATIAAIRVLRIAVLLLAKKAFSRS